MRMDRLVKKAFTLVEVLVVITIITILAGLILGGIGGATTQSLKANTKSTLMTLTVALERYKKDNGDYPWTVSTTLNGTQKTIIEALLKYESFNINDSDGGVIDNWDSYIVFVPSAAYSATTAVQINSSLMSGVYYNPSSFQLISAGPDLTIGTSNPFGTASKDTDNIYNFEKK